jgi:hypothetical protein
MLIWLSYLFKGFVFSPQEVTQLAGTTPNEMKVISSNFFSPSYADM